ncbi:precorrin-4 C(11)-methyltransferase [Tenacibaculum finnmarkense]|uniref:Precorrin-4 C(11)-methyltransferase n=1 Tax=Tenacibaculum finnmarkense genomovar finnmarkense TaxID=1458503 RepID=A0AAP1REQ4_9FLAO|nr:precorrin-4 C(11)-methyltransferase [Tenacibaculum finnmarkense]MBE7652508.1 precorrin-4 C(11)-methyltransferase [Tenacibaculum finnmarkense genomovar finnmarkense]MBE7694682.1 precorrin-4 C(11)-methyltransferase [Tenacibaculum finnmarkense genomovar finnmarkense]MCD8427007.1 precorrin-4 C(11)-methyltransferase [Tenacibaculum finnmarkense genomovar finnmarkense]MCG8731143.1 precorrin-4 C(11)-methyltransferase [Tenacibaculum finnmarkense]MCG8752513.1 precorrin-4 C(11)-methyltransferase [Tena
MKKIAIIAVTEKGLEKALIIQKEFSKSLVITTLESTNGNVSTITSISDYLTDNFSKLDGICFVTALGICVRLIAPYIQDKNTDPAVISVDDLGVNVQSVLSGHKGGANNFALKVSAVLGANPVISTSSDVQEIWALDTLGTQFDWQTESSLSITKTMALFVNNKPTALLLDIKDKGTQHLEKTVPSFVTVFYDEKDIDYTQFDLFIAVSYKIYEAKIASLFLIPKVLSVGSGCSKELDFSVFQETFKTKLANEGLHFSAIKNFGSIDIKANQQAYLDFSTKNNIPFSTFTSDEINTISIPNPSEMVQSKIGVAGVSESCAMLLSGNKELLVEKQKIHIENNEKFTFSVALDAKSVRKTAIAIIGAGPGDEELITVKGKIYLEEADCVLYAGSLIPEEMTNWCKAGAVVRNSAMMTLEEQVSLMQEHYKKGNSIVRLQCGDPSLYGAIQEQMTIFDELDMEYFIVPGISSFSAAAAVLKSEFTIPEVVQSIVLTRGEGKTPMPSKESISAFAATNSTMCIFLSAGIASKVQAQLLEHFDADTPVAVLYRITWKDEEIYQGKLENLAEIVKKSKKTRTVLIVVGSAIGARKNRSQLYNPEWKHIFRTNKKFVVTE